MLDDRRIHAGDAAGARPMTIAQSESAEDVTCEALHLALSALHIDIAWHAGVMNAEAAMERLHREIGKSINWRSGSTRTGSLEQPSDLSPAPRR